MVAGVDVAVVLDDQRVAARLAHRADARLHTAPLRQRGVEQLHETAPHVAYDPLIENIAQEMPVAFGRDRPAGQPRPFVSGRDDQRTVVSRFVDDVFDGGQELHEAAVHLVAEEAVDLPAAPLAAPVHDAQRIEFHAAAPEHPDRPHHALEGRFAAPGQAEGVVDIPGPVEREADQEIVGGEEVAPRLVDQRTVGLQRILDPFAVGVPALQLHRPAVEIQPQQQRLAAVPAELHGIDLVGPDVLFYAELQQLVVHHGLAAAVLHRLVEVVAVVAVEVAGRARRFEHDREGRGGDLFLRVAERKYLLLFHGAD